MCKGGNVIHRRACIPNDGATGGLESSREVNVNDLMMPSNVPTDVCHYVDLSPAIDEPPNKVKHLSGEQL